MSRSHLSRSHDNLGQSSARHHRGNNNGTHENAVVVFIPAALKRPSHTLYCICVKVDETAYGGAAAEWSVNRRYSQFLELRKQIIAFLMRSQTCPGCQSMMRAVGAFPFPPKAFFRTNKLVRQRTKDLQTFVEIVIARTFSATPKCVTCGTGIMNLVWPFFNRGAQNIVRNHTMHCRPADAAPPAKKTIARNAASDCSTADSVQDMNDYEVHRRTTHKLRKSLSESDVSNAVFMTCRSDTSESNNSLVKYRSLKQDKAAFVKPMVPSIPDTPTTAADDDVDNVPAAESLNPLAYLKTCAEKCLDPRSSVANVEEALNEVIIADGHANTKEEKMYRLSTMWEAFELEDIQRELASNRGGILV
ncbi:Aste57867_14267 [Aphanomyces stellatus]|uniref:Aste57867_14267 protein n=1 Tax=Aphanomyces stellatus TaxID=120398 RepID=A0A485L127_9STRA|nr:hypothetical protein As57867_014216 [Aphanomyces stellatus]VFT91092.1 Aste57867_14267 [Aphanomyces stellatus]